MSEHESRGALGDINQKPRPERPLVKEDIVENPEDFDELEFYELSKNEEEGKVKEINTVEKKAPNMKVKDTIKDNKVSFMLGGAFRNRLPYKENIPDEWIISREDYKDLNGKHIYEATFFIHAEFKLSWIEENMTLQLDKLRKGLYLLEKSWDWEKDENCLEGYVSNNID